MSPVRAGWEARLGATPSSARWMEVLLKKRSIARPTQPTQVIGTACFSICWHARIRIKFEDGIQRFKLARDIDVGAIFSCLVLRVFLLS